MISFSMKFTELLPDEAAACDQFLRHKTLLVQPYYFTERGIPVFAVSLFYHQKFIFSFLKIFLIFSEIFKFLFFSYIFHF